MEAANAGITPRYYSLSDAARVIGVKPELVLRALAQLPALKQRNGLWTIEDLTQIDAVVLALVAGEEAV